jgi:prephenate dehydrogenase
MAKASITIIGLGRIGSSIGLALKAPELDYEIVGHDKDSLVQKKAREMGAVDSTAWNLLSACESADVVMLAIPFDQVRETLQTIGPELRPNCVVIDTSFLKEPVLAWAKKYLREDVHFVGISLGLNPDYALDSSRGPGSARADLFAKSPCALMPALNCRPEAVKASQDLAVLLGATPYFMDPTEYDGLSTAINLLPGLMAAAVLRPTMDAPSWREMRRIASSDLAHFSIPLEVGGQSLAQAAVLSKENVLRWLDTIVEEIQILREQIEEGQKDRLGLQIEAIYESRDKWLGDWERNRWERSAATSEISGPGSIFGQLFGFGRKGRSERSEN